jgi:hypothetical protein
LYLHEVPTTTKEKTKKQLEAFKKKRPSKIIITKTQTSKIVFLFRFKIANKALYYHSFETPNLSQVG